MNLRIILSIAVLCSNLNLLAQETVSDQVEQDYRAFRKLFDKEFKTTDSTSVSSIHAFHPVALPKWLTNLPESNTETVYSVGISDPGMEIKTAHELAYLRAKVLTALYLNPNVSSITDFYSKEKSYSKTEDFVTKYVNYYRLLAAINSNDTHFEIINTEFTSYGEAIVLTKYSSVNHTVKTTDSLMLQIDFYIAERQLDNRFAFEEKCETYGLSKTNNSGNEIDLFYYFYRAVNQFYEIVSRYNGTAHEFPQTLFRYQSLTPPVASQPEGISFKLTNGLWKAFIQSVVQNYVLEADRLDVEISGIGDNYSQASQNLTRELIEKDPALRMRSLCVENNRLGVLFKSIESKP